MNDANNSRIALTLAAAVEAHDVARRVVAILSDNGASREEMAPALAWRKASGARLERVKALYARSLAVTLANHRARFARSRAA